MAQTAEGRIRRARAALVMRAPFWGVLASRLQLVSDPGCGTSATDGTHLFFAPAYIDSLDDEQLVGLLAHEVAHNVLGHPWRRNGRNKRLWNVACDYAIDMWLHDNNFVVPDAFLRAAWRGWSAERCYAELEKDMLSDISQGGCDDEEQQSSGNARSGTTPSGDGDDGSGGDDAPRSLQEAVERSFGSQTKGEVLDAPADTALRTEQDWRIAVASAAKLALSRGSFPAAMRAMLDFALRPKVQWRSVLRRFISVIARSDYSWSRPSRRYAHLGLYLPSLIGKRMGEIALVVDTSGSTSALQQQFLAEFSAIMDDVRPTKLHYLQADAQVQRYEELACGDKIVPSVLGFGGTDFRPAFDFIAQRNISPVCLVYLTDCFGRYPKRPPVYPVLWASTTDPRRLGGQYQPPFGDVIYVE